MESFKRIYVATHKPLLRWVLAVDFLLIFISVMMGVLLMVDIISKWPNHYNIGRDASVSEHFNFAKWAAIISVFGYAYYKRRLLIFACLAVVFALILADDYFQLHEQAGRFSRSIYGEDLRIAVALAEIGFWIALALTCLAILALAWRKTSNACRRELRPLAALFAGVVICGAGVDFIHYFTEKKSWTAGVLMIIEDGGEMIFISLMLAYAIGAFGPGATSRTAQAAETR